MLNNIDNVNNVNIFNKVNNVNNINDVNNVNNINCKSVKSATLAHHLRPIFGLVSSFSINFFLSFYLCIQISTKFISLSDNQT